MRTYNLFRRKGRTELVCAIPEDRLVPDFITGASWEFGGKLENAHRHPFAFNREAADASVRVNGFYLFQMTKPLEVSKGGQEIGRSSQPGLGENISVSGPCRANRRSTAGRLECEFRLG